MPSSIPPSTAFTTTNPYLERAYSLASSPPAARALYDEWASTYDTDLSAQSYNSPTAAAAALAAHLPAAAAADESPKLTILDAGCGTGLVGLALYGNEQLKGRIGELDGLDLSEGMLAVARKTGVYGKLETADLTQRIERGDGSVDVVMCVGTLTKGHVGPAVLGEFVRVVKPEGGLVMATVLDAVWVEGGFEKEVERLRGEGGVEVLGAEDFGITENEGKGGKMLVLRRVG